MIFSCPNCASSTLDRQKSECAHCGGSFIEDPTFDPPSFNGVDLVMRTFTNEDLRCADFTNAGLVKCRFVRCQLQGARFVNADLVKCTFDDCDTRDMDMTGSGQVAVTGL